MSSRLHLRARCLGVLLISLVVFLGACTWPPILALIIVAASASEYSRIAAQQVWNMRNYADGTPPVPHEVAVPDATMRCSFLLCCTSICLAALHSHQAMTCAALVCSFAALGWMLFRVIETPGHHVRVPTAAERLSAARRNEAEQQHREATNDTRPPAHQLLGSTVLESVHLYFEVLVHLFGIWYCGFLFSHAALILYHPSYAKDGMEGAGYAGIWRLGYVIFVTAGGENGGMLAGSLLGRTKFTPRISPNKSRAGAVAQVLVSGAMSVIMVLVMPLGLENHLPAAFVLGLILGVIATLGDLFESLLKRSVGWKDAGRIIPGAGGMLDRMDGLMFTFPAFYYYLEYVQPWIIAGEK
jgi:hypothetical protein